MNQMRLDIAERLVEIEDAFKNYDFSMTGITLIARDPTNENMIVVLSNEDSDGKVEALRLALAGNGMTRIDGDGNWLGKQSEGLAT